MGALARREMTSAERVVFEILETLPGVVVDSYNQPTPYSQGEKFNFILRVNNVPVFLNVDQPFHFFDAYGRVAAAQQHKDADIVILAEENNSDAQFIRIRSDDVTTKEHLDHFRDILTNINILNRMKQHWVNKKVYDEQFVEFG